MTRGDEGMRMLEGIEARTEMVMDVDQVGRENLKGSSSRVFKNENIFRH